LGFSWRGKFLAYIFCFSGFELTLTRNAKQTQEKKRGKRKETPRKKLDFFFLNGLFSRFCCKKLSTSFPRLFSRCLFLVFALPYARNAQKCHTKKKAVGRTFFTRLALAFFHHLGPLMTWQSLNSMFTEEEE
jgi:hypothetical protein